MNKKGSGGKKGKSGRPTKRDECLAVDIEEASLKLQKRFYGYVGEVIDEFGFDGVYRKGDDEKEYDSRSWARSIVNKAINQGHQIYLKRMPTKLQGDEEHPLTVVAYLPRVKDE